MNFVPRGTIRVVWQLAAGVICALPDLVNDVGMVLLESGAITSPLQVNFIIIDAILKPGIFNLKPVLIRKFVILKVFLRTSVDRVIDVLTAHLSSLVECFNHVVQSYMDVSSVVF